MEIPQFKSVCSICGGPSVTDSKGTAYNWYGLPIVHVDPKSCLRYKQSKEYKDKKAKEALAEFLFGFLGEENK